ncbi:MAG: caspase family protein [Leptospiraceae bacterium]|nr:caspase family protein [Leptospiraceae bacterium]MCP5510291.1 caspase family protein [Leptospiraceae bacterium]
MRKLLVLLVLLLGITSSLYSQKKYALIIGSNYKGNKAGISELNLCEADATYMESQIKKVGNFDDIKMLLGKDVTKVNIEKEIKSIGSRAKTDDVVFLFFAGHGFYQRDSNAKNGMRNYIVCYDRPHLSDDELNTYLSSIKSPKTVFAFDCCFSGGIAKKGKATRGDKEVPIPEGANGIVKESDDFFFQNKAIISSADDNQTAIEIGGKINHGIFTYHFGRAMETADLNGDKVVTALEAFFKTREEVIKTAKSVDHEQVPQVSGNASGIFLAGNKTPDPPPVVEDPKPVNDPKPEPTPDPIKPDPVKPPVTDEEPPAVNVSKNGDLIIKTTIIKDARYGLNSLDPMSRLKNKNKKGDRAIKVLIDDKDVDFDISAEFSDTWGASSGRKGQVYVLTVKDVPAGVHKITVRADDYPEVETTFAVMENKKNELVLQNSMTGYGAIEGQVFYKTLDNPVMSHPIWMPTVKSLNGLKKIKTDKDGKFIFTNLLPGSYEIKASFMESLPLANADIKVKEGEITRIQIILNVKLKSTKTKY